MAMGRIKHASSTLSIIYVSRANGPISAPELQQLADLSAAANAACGVTGLLAYNSRSFMQLLEGAGEDVLDTVRRIERDQRHDNLTFIRQQERETRECPDWSMRAIRTPLTGIGSVSVFTGSLPGNLELDTQILFTSFASMLSAAEAARQVERKRDLLGGQQPENDP